MAKGQDATSYAGTLQTVKPQKDVSVTVKKQKPQLSVCNKLCFAFGGAPYQITGSALGFFLQMFLLDVAQLDPLNASIILFAGRAWDAITDPTVGFLVSHSRWTRVGRMMPWILCSTPFAVLTYFLIWYVPPFEEGKVVWFLVFYCLFQSMQTCFHVPYSALTMFISTKQEERDSATAYRMTVELLGILLGTAIQGQIVGSVSTCPVDDDNDDYKNSTIPPTVNRTITSLEESKKAHMISSGVICIIYILCSVILFLGVKEQKECVQRKSKLLTFRQGLKLIVSHGPYVKLVSAFLCATLGFLLMEGNFSIFLSYSLGQRKDFQNILLVIMLSGTLTIPWWQWFLTRFGKKTAAFCSNLWVIPFIILMVSVKSNLALSYVVSVAAGMSVGASYFLPWSMLPDVVDDFKVTNPNVHGHEAIFYSFFVFFTKFASGLSLGISTLCLKFAGYVTGSCLQPESVSTTLKVLVSAFPIALIIVGLLILRMYPIDEKRRQSNSKVLQARLESESETPELGSIA
uniref:Major facilitator superfamily domain containing 2A n=1 Tax=Oryzias latipes TaxID=8090 RepID=A0A3P9K138_ORYLA